MNKITLDAIKKRRYKKRDGRCYEIGYKFVEDNPSWILVHAVINPPTGRFKGLPYPHCFCENDTYIYDPVLDVVYQKNEYYSVYKITDAIRYDLVTAAKTMVQNKHYGPWTDEHERLLISIEPLEEE